MKETVGVFFWTQCRLQLAAGDRIRHVNATREKADEKPLAPA